MTTAIDVVSFGELLWDFYEAEPREKEPIARLFRRELGGTAANVAVTLARLGIKVAAVGAVGDDKLGAALEGQLSADGVDTSHVLRIDAPTGLTFVSVAANAWAADATVQHATATLIPRRRPA